MKSLLYENFSLVPILPLLKLVLQVFEPCDIYLTNNLLTAALTPLFIRTTKLADKVFYLAFEVNGPPMFSLLCILQSGVNKPQWERKLLRPHR